MRFSCYYFKLFASVVFSLSFSAILFPIKADAALFLRTLKLGSKGSDVFELQKMLNKSVDTQVASVGDGSPGHETTYFGPATKRAVMQFQLKYRNEILLPNGLTQATGIVAASSQKKLAELQTVAASTAASPIPLNIHSGYVVPTQTQTNQSVQSYGGGGVGKTIFVAAPSYSGAGGGGGSGGGSAVISTTITAPVITLVGSSTVDVIQNESFVDPGATVADAEEGNITSRLSASGTVNTSLVGTYTITYIATDTSSLAAIPVIRTVRVIQLPIINFPFASTSTEPLSGRLSLNASITNAAPINAFQILIDNAVVASSSLQSISYNWNTASTTNATHTIAVRAIAQSGRVVNTATTSIPVFNSPPAPVLSGNLVTTFNSTGLNTLSYQGTSLTNNNDQPLYTTVYTLNNDGSVSQPSQSLISSSWDSAEKKVTRQYSWGTYKITFSTSSPTSLDMKIELTNSTQTTFAGFSSWLVNMHLPYANTGNPVFAASPYEPAAAISSFTGGTVAFVQTGAPKDLLLVYETTNDPTQYVVLLNTTKSYGPNSWPDFHNIPIAPGQTQTLHFSLRFAAPNTPAQTIASDAYTTFKEKFPFDFNWTDRRPIGRVLPSSSGGYARVGTNPRGWFNDVNVDVTSTSGLQAFYNRLLTYASGTVAILQDLHAQGVISWDMEGEQYPDLTYVGDPRVIEQMAPELTYNGLLDKYFKVFSDAGFTNGLTLRPLKIAFDASGTPYAAPIPDLAVDFIDKITYAKNRWGAKLFYIDSTDAVSIDPLMYKIHQAVPDVLLMPENENFSMYADSAPYNELRGGFTGVPENIRSLYPNSFAVYTPDSIGTASTSTYNKVVDSVRQGDVLMWNAWYQSDEIAKIKQIYHDAGRSGF